jgi:TPR repeat protein
MIQPDPDSGAMASDDRFAPEVRAGAGPAASVRQRIDSSWALMPIVAASGFAGLGYEIVWTRQLSLALGSEMMAVLGAVAGFFAPALRGNARAQALLGFMYENGFGVPQAYDAAADFYQRAAVQGEPFGQSRLGLIYDKGHGVPQDVVLAYKWLDLAAAHAAKRERDYYLRLRNAVASKMSSDQIAEGQRLALFWAPGRW